MPEDKCEVYDAEGPEAVRASLGGSILVEEASAVTPFHEPTIQLLRFHDGSIALRFCAYHGSSLARMPLIVSDEHLEALAKDVRRNPGTRKLLEKEVERTSGPTLSRHRCLLS